MSLTPLRDDDDPELEAAREQIRRGRRGQAKRLLGIGAGLVIAAAGLLWKLADAREATSGDAASGTMVGILFAMAGLTGLIGLALAGTAVFVLAKARSGHTEQDT